MTSKSRLQNAIMFIQAHADAMERFGTKTILSRDLRTIAEALPDILDEDTFSSNTDFSARPSERSSQSRLQKVDISSLDFEYIERFINDESTIKADLEKILIERFGFPRGSTKRLSKKDIIDSIRNNIRNSKGHETISRLASDSSLKPKGTEDK